MKISCVFESISIFFPNQMGCSEARLKNVNKSVEFILVKYKTHRVNKLVFLRDFDVVLLSMQTRDCRGLDRMVVGFTTIYAISAYHHWCCEFESRSGRGEQHYVIKFVSDRSVIFSRSSGFPPQINLTATI